MGCCWNLPESWVPASGGENPRIPLGAAAPSDEPALKAGALTRPKAGWWRISTGPVLRWQLQEMSCSTEAASAICWRRSSAASSGDLQEALRPWARCQPLERDLANAPSRQDRRAAGTSMHVPPAAGIPANAMRYRPLFADFPATAARPDPVCSATAFHRQSGSLTVPTYRYRAAPVRRKTGDDLPLVDGCGSELINRGQLQPIYRLAHVLTEIAERYPSLVHRCSSRASDCLSELPDHRRTAGAWGEPRRWATAFSTSALAVNSGGGAAEGHLGTCDAPPSSTASSQTAAFSKWWRKIIAVLAQ